MQALILAGGDQTLGYIWQLSFLLPLALAPRKPHAALFLLVGAAFVQLNLAGALPAVSILLAGAITCAMVILLRRGRPNFVLLMAAIYLLGPLTTAFRTPAAVPWTLVAALLWALALVAWQARSLQAHTQRQQAELRQAHQLEACAKNLHAHAANPLARAILSLDEAALSAPTPQAWREDISRALTAVRAALSDLQTLSTCSVTSVDTTLPPAKPQSAPSPPLSLDQVLGELEQRLSAQDLGLEVIDERPREGKTDSDAQGKSPNLNPLLLSFIEEAGSNLLKYARPGTGVSLRISPRQAGGIEVEFTNLIGLAPLQERFSSGRGLAAVRAELEEQGGALVALRSGEYWITSAVFPEKGWRENGPA